MNACVDVGVGVGVGVGVDVGVGLGGWMSMHIGLACSAHECSFFRGIGTPKSMCTQPFPLAPVNNLQLTAFTLCLLSLVNSPRACTA